MDLYQTSSHHPLYKGLVSDPLSPSTHASLTRSLPPRPAPATTYIWIVPGSVSPRLTHRPLLLIARLPVSPCNPVAPPLHLLHEAWPSPTTAAAVELLILGATSKDPSADDEYQEYNTANNNTDNSSNRKAVMMTIIPAAVTAATVDCHDIFFGEIEGSEGAGVESFVAPARLNIDARLVVYAVPVAAADEFVFQW